MTIIVSLTPKTVIIDDTKISTTLDHATLFKTLKHLLHDAIKVVLEAQFTTIRNMFTQEIESLISKKLLIMSNIQAKAMNWTIDKIWEDKGVLRIHVADLLREERSMAAAKSTLTLTPTTTVTPLPVVLDLEVAVVAANRQSLNQYTA